MQNHSQLAQQSTLRRQSNVWNSLFISLCLLGIVLTGCKTADDKPGKPDPKKPAEQTSPKSEKSNDKGADQAVEPLDVSALGGNKACPESKNLPPLKPGEKPVELGTIDWVRNLKQGLQESLETGKPVMLLFDEVPGCGKCRDFGKQVLSNPVIRAAAEANFVPVS